MSQSELEKFRDNSIQILVAPLVKQIENFNNASSLRNVLNILEPYKLHNAMVEGVNDFLNQYGNYVTTANFNKVKYVFSKLDENTNELLEVWTILDKYDRTSVLDYIDEGMFSDETIFGAAIGSILLPGLGTFLGALWGGYATGKRINNQAQEIIEAYMTGMKKYIEIFQDCIEQFLDEFIYDICCAIEAQENQSGQLPSNSSQCPYCGNSLSSTAINRGRCSECGKYF